MESVTIRAGGADVVLSDEEAEAAYSALRDYKVAKRTAWEAAQRAAGQVWVANYWRHHCDYHDEFFSEDEAVGFLLYGSEAGDLAMESVKRPDGTLIDRDALDALDDARCRRDA